MTDVATDCDECGVDIPYNVTAYAIPNGKTEDGLPVYRILCEACYDKGES